MRNIVEVQKSGKLGDHVGIRSESIVSPGLFCCPLLSPGGCETLIFCGKVRNRGKERVFFSYFLRGYATTFACI